MLSVRHRRARKLAGVKCIAGDLPLIDRVGRMEKGIDARNSRRAGANRVGAESPERRATAGNDVWPFDLLDAPLVLVVIAAGPQTRQPKRAGRFMSCLRLSDLGLRKGDSR